MKVIADSGSTKTEWRIIEKNQVRSFRGNGLNAVFLSKAEIENELSRLKEKEIIQNPDEVYFYGAGVTTKMAENSLKEAFKTIFGGDVNLSINDDVLGASRSLFGNNSGIACILGTGSNSCLYLKGSIKSKIPSLGYILGDEGSGNDIGKRFLNALLKNDFHPELKKKISGTSEFSIENVIENTYRKPLANRYLASISRIVKTYENEEVIRKIVKDAFNSFLEKNVSKYDNYLKYDIGFAGSIAYHFKDILKECLEDKGIENYVSVEHPIEGLVKYHQSF